MLSNTTITTITAPTNFITAPTNSIINYVVSRPQLYSPHHTIPHPALVFAFQRQFKICWHDTASSDRSMQTAVKQHGTQEPHGHSERGREKEKKERKKERRISRTYLLEFFIFLIILFSCIYCIPSRFLKEYRQVLGADTSSFSHSPLNGRPSAVRPSATIP